MDKILETVNLTKLFYSQNEILKILCEINFIVDRNDTISITGESGTGKSTFLNLIGGLDSITSGSIKIENKEITELDETDLTFFRNKKVGFIFQDHYLLEEFNAIENIIMPFLINNYNLKEAKDKALYFLNFLGIYDRRHHFPAQMSGGEKQRVAIARAFINDPLIILADEPTGNLDEKNSGKVLELLFNISNNEKHSLIIVSHSSIVKTLALKNYLLEGGKLHRI